MGGISVTVKDRILIHLLPFARRIGSPPEDVTQKGIAKAVGIRRSHVPRALKQLIQSGHVIESRDRVGSGRALKVYRLTETGLKEASSREAAVRDSPIEVVHRGGRRHMTVGEACEAYSLRPVDVLREAPEGVLDIEPRGVPSEAGDFVDREEELSLLRAWYRRGAPLMVVYGGAGYGKTALVQRFLSVAEVPRPKWVDLQKGDTPGNVAAALRVPVARGTRPAESEESPEHLAREVVAAKHSLIVFDGYEDLGEQIVEFFRTLSREAASMGGTKILVLARDTTPSYSRFYGRGAISRDEVEELHLAGLDAASSKLLLRAPDIDEDAFKRIYLLTRGCPLHLRLIREEDARELKRRSRFTNPEIRLLIFSKDVR